MTRTLLVAMAAQLRARSNQVALATIYLPYVHVVAEELFAEMVLLRAEKPVMMGTL